MSFAVRAFFELFNTEKPELKRYGMAAAVSRGGFCLPSRTACGRALRKEGRAVFLNTAAAPFLRRVSAEGCAEQRGLRALFCAAAGADRAYRGGRGNMIACTFPVHEVPMQRKTR